MIYSCTNWHVVDEDERAISVHGGYWVHGVYTGIAHREVSVTSTNNQDTVAFSQKKINRTYSPFGDAYYSLTCPVAVKADVAGDNGYHPHDDSYWKLPAPGEEAPNGPQLQTERDRNSRRCDTEDQMSPALGGKSFLAAQNPQTDAQADCNYCDYHATDEPQPVHIFLLLTSITFSDTIVFDKLSSPG